MAKINSKPSFPTIELTLTPVETRAFMNIMNNLYFDNPIFKDERVSNVLNATPSNVEALDILDDVYDNVHSFLMENFNDDIREEYLYEWEEE